MRVRDVAIVLAVVVIAAVSFKRGRDSRRMSAASAPAPEQPSAAAPVTPSGTPASSTASAAADRSTTQALAPARDLKVIQERIREGAPGTYIEHMLIGKEHMLQRWPDRMSEPLRVWIQSTASIPDWNVTYPVVAERAFDEWRAAGFPIRFDMIRDSAGADIQILFVQQMPKDDSLRIGVTVLQFDRGGTIHRGAITIATHDFQGRPIPAELVAGTARHEVGHVLGLGHSYRTNDVMFPESRTPVISDFDRATLHLLYTLPPGPVK